MTYLPKATAINQLWLTEFIYDPRLDLIPKENPCRELLAKGLGRGSRFPIELAALTA
jgi:hypothetical protein